MYVQNFLAELEDAFATYIWAENCVCVQKMLAQNVLLGNFYWIVILESDEKLSLTGLSEYFSNQPLPNIKIAQIGAWDGNLEEILWRSLPLWESYFPFLTGYYN